MKRLCTLACALVMLAGCGGCGGGGGGSAFSTEVGGWCYLESGLYLVTGDRELAVERARAVIGDWPSEGYIADVFKTYNDDPDLELFEEHQTSVTTMHRYQDEGYRVVVTYLLSNGEHHSRPLEWHEDFRTVDYWASVAGHFNGATYQSPE